MHDRPQNVLAVCCPMNLTGNNQKLSLMAWIFNPLSDQFGVFLFAETCVSLEKRFFETFSHLSFCIFKPSFNTVFHCDFVNQSDSFIFRRNELKNFEILIFVGSFTWNRDVIDVKFLDSLETFFNMFVNFCRIFTVSE